MAEKIKKNDFVEIDYTGKLLDGMVFDTTVKNIAEKNGIGSQRAKFGPTIICVGEKQVIPGLDDDLAGKEVGKDYVVNLSPETAFGKRDIKKMKVVPISDFKDQKMRPQPGLQIENDKGEIGTITRVSGGRIIVNFNHPLAGKEVSYEYKIHKIVTDEKVKVVSYLNKVLRIPEEKLNVEIKEQEATIKVPFDLPPQFTKAVEEQLVKIVGLKKASLVGVGKK